MNWIERMEVLLTTSKTSTQPSNNLSFTAKPKRSTKAADYCPHHRSIKHFTRYGIIKPGTRSDVRLACELGSGKTFKDKTRLLGKY
jgi:hypothetical protein